MICLKLPNESMAEIRVEPGDFNLRFKLSCGPLYVVKRV